MHVAGMATSQIGSRDKLVERILALYIPALLPAQAADMPTQASVQASAMLGLGLLHLGSANRYFVEVLLKEMGRTLVRGLDTAGPTSTPVPGPIGAVSIGLEAYALSAGLGVGFLLLGQGTSADAIADLPIDQTLRRYLLGTAAATDGATTATRAPTATAAWDHGGLTLNGYACGVREEGRGGVRGVKGGVPHGCRGPRRGRPPVDRDP